jgi:hypothetical protein
MSSIGVLREGPLHAALKAAMAQPGDRLEVALDRFVIDLIRADGELVEVQTGGFGPLGAKLDALLDQHAFRIVYPIAAERRIVRVGDHGEVLSIRRSPRRATAVEVFDKLVTFPSLLGHPNLTLEVLLLREDHLRAARPATNRLKRRTTDPGERRLVDVLGRVEIRGPDDIVNLLPPLPLAPFSTRELASLLGCSLRLAQQTAYCLRMLEIIESAGKRGRTPLHRRAVRTAPSTTDMAPPQAATKHSGRRKPPGDHRQDRAGTGRIFPMRAGEVASLRSADESQGRRFS